MHVEGGSRSSPCEARPIRSPDAWSSRAVQLRPLLAFTRAARSSLRDVPLVLDEPPVGFGPTLLLVALFVWIARRQVSASGGVLGGLGRSTARHVTRDEHD